MIKVWAKTYSIEASSGQAGAVNFGPDLYTEVSYGSVIGCFAQPNSGGSWGTTVGTRIDGSYLYVEPTDTNSTTYNITLYALYR